MLNCVSNDGNLVAIYRGNMVITVYSGQQVKETHNLAEKVNYKRGHRVTEMRFIENDKVIRIRLDQQAQFSEINVTIGGSVEVKDSSMRFENYDALVKIVRDTPHLVKVPQANNRYVALIRQDPNKRDEDCKKFYLFDLETSQYCR